MTRGINQRPRPAGSDLGGRSSVDRQLASRRQSRHRTGRSRHTPLPVLVFASLLLVLTNPVAALAAPLLPVCSWPFEVTGQGLTNIATPDTNATYWVMPLDTEHWPTMVINGDYPNARFFNVTSYGAAGGLVDSVLDQNINPEPGSSNPFSTQNGPNRINSYRLTVGGNATGSANTLRVASGRFSFIVYRVYAPNKGLDRMGGVDLPRVSVLDRSGNARQLRPCPTATAEASLTALILLLRANGLDDAANFLQGILQMAATTQRSLVPCNSGQQGAAVAFSPATLNTDFFPNPVTTYLETAGLCLPSNKVLVVRGKAPVFPNTYLGGSVFTPAFDGQIQMRYWSMCQNDRVIPYPVVGCEADFETNRDANGFYTYVVSPTPPEDLPADATWIPWGNVSVPKNLIFRVTLPATPAPDYAPKAAFCDETAITASGVQACFAAAGVSAP
jgi:hypothetical protein